MEIKPKLYKLIKRFITQSTKGSDVFMHHGSKWIIFVEDKKWVIELTKEGTLWYNYYFFQNIFELVDLAVVENQHYITKWVEDTIQNGVKNTQPNLLMSELTIEETIKIGIKKTKAMDEWVNTERIIENTIQNGVKETHSGCDLLINDKVEDTIQNGVKHTHWVTQHQELEVEDTIQNGVKYTGDRQGNYNLVVEDTIQNGVKKTYSDKIPHEYDWSNQFTEEIDDIIQNGVKETKLASPDGRDYFIEGAIQNGVKHTEYGDWEDGDERFDDIIQNGVKETKEEPSQRTWMSQQVIQNGIKTTQSGILFDESKIDTVINEGVKEIRIKELSESQVNRIIKNGVKECKPSHTPQYNPMDFSVQYRENHRLDDVASVLEKGIKEVRPLPSQEGNMDWGDYYYRQGVPTKPHTKYVDDTIRDGVKETWGYEKQSQDRINEVIENGTKENPS